MLSSPYCNGGVPALGADVARIKAVLDTLRQSLDSTALAIDSVHGEIRIKLEHIERERDELRERLSETLERSKIDTESHAFKMSQLEAAIDELRDEKRQLRNSGAESDAALKALRDVHSHLQRNLDQRERQQQQLEQRLAEKEAQSEQRTSEFLSSTRALQREFSESKSAHEKSERSLRKLLEEAQRQRDELQQNLGSAEAAMLRAETDAKHSIAQLEEALARTTSERDDCRTQCRQLTEDLQLQADTMKGIADGLQRDKRRLTRSNEAMAAEMEGLRMRIRELEAESAQKDLSLEMFVREIGHFTDSRSLSRLTCSSSSKRSDSAQETLLLDRYMQRNGDRRMSICDFISCMVELDILAGVQLIELLDLFKEASAAFIGWIDIVSAYKDLHTLSETFDAITKSGHLTRLELKKVFEKAGLELHKQEYLPSFNAVVMHADREGDENIDRREFMKIVLMLIVLHVLFVEMDTDLDGELSLREIIAALHSHRVDTKFINKVKATYSDYTVGAKENLAHEGFMGVILANLQRRF